MKWVFTGMIILSFLAAIVNGNVEELSNAAIGESANAVSLVLTLLGSMCLWGGFMKIVEVSGLSEKIGKLLQPVTKLLFPGLKQGSKAMHAITMNITANLLGLGNAATPLGIQAMEELKKEEPTGMTATPNMTMLVVLNTASIQLLPTTVAALRYEAGSAAPMEILPAVLFSSVVSAVVAVLFVRLTTARRNRHASKH